MKPNTRDDGYSDSYFDEGEVYQIMQASEERRRKKKKDIDRDAGRNEG